MAIHEEKASHIISRGKKNMVIHEPRKYFPPSLVYKKNLNATEILCAFFKYFSCNS